MPDDTDATEAQGAEDAQPQGGEAQAQGAEAQEAQGASADQSGSGDDGKPKSDKLRALERDNAKYRRKIAELEKAEQARKEAELSELERATNRIAELERAASESQVREQERTSRLAVVTEAARQGFADPADAWGLIDRASLEYDEDGEPTNVKALLEALITSKSYLRSAAARPSGSIDIGASGSTPTLDSRIREAEEKGDWTTARALKSQKLAQQMQASPTR